MPPGPPAAIPRGNPRIADWTNRRVWLLGASAGIGEALAHALAGRGAKLVLSARNAPALADLARALGPGHCTLALDATDSAALDAAFARFDSGELPLPSVGVYLAGDYQPLDARQGETALPAARHMLAVNYAAAVEWSLRLAPRLLATPAPASGIALVASVAGYTGLPQALAYSPSKAALIRFAECLYLDLAPQSLGVWAINPGFVATRLTAQNDFEMPALMPPEAAAEAIVRGFASGRFEIHFPTRFTRLLKIAAILPYALSMPLFAHIARKKPR
ncbi:MAG TPA: SDR family NAD(P)-dependent oxidoreductase, partial [Accumulibacter sp.]|nr:SDR family NAD(P)-dependent oxidoreductase [Accumulibacter sp.]